jgi:hypothetical protein
VCYRGQRDGEVDYGIAATSVKGGCISAFGANHKPTLNPMTSILSIALTLGFVAFAAVTAGLATIAPEWPS